MAERRRGLAAIGRLAGAAHPLVDESGATTRAAENLSLRKWIGISGAAISPGRGQTTRLGTALLFGLANLRTGYWWDSGVVDAARDGFPQLSFFRRLLVLIPRLFITQALILFEWVARYPGPWERFWYISDGGFFENLAGYELIRRRVPRIILSDCGADPAYDFEDFANLTRKARIDFDAEITPWTASEIESLPAEIQVHLGSLDDLRPRPRGEAFAPASLKHAALFWINYGASSRRSVLLYLKATATGDETRDVLNYQASHPEFPHEATGDQFFDEAQWESYRELGKHIATPLFGGSRWFWEIPLSR